MDASGASSSSTAAHPINNSGVDYRCGVFINHRGPDTKKTFASYLYRRLLIHGLRPFLDQEELEVGSNFPTQIVDTIRSASVHVAIFSTSYAHSPWCLRELVLMLESKAPMIPIFYHVDPAALRWTDQPTKGVYAVGLNQLQMKTTVDPQTHEKKPRYDSATLQKWRNALSTVADTSGFDLLGKFNGDEGLLLDEVVKRVLEIMSVNTQLDVAKNPTGLDDKIEDFEATVLAQQHTGEVQVVGIVGLGGVGKTTLAKEIFNRKHPEYSNSYFLSDVRENARISLHSLQSKLIKGLFHWDRQIDNIHQGTKVLRQFFSSCKIFLILDDIDHVNQVDVLLPDTSFLHKDSLILITSRDEGVLARSGVKESSMYRLTGLPYYHSQQLFCLYAFCQPYSQPGFEDLVNKFLMACDGLPLSLIVFGALLSGHNDKCDWEAILHQLELPKDIKNTLKVSYDALAKEEQQIFLDIACFFIGEKKNRAVTVWEGSGWKGSLGFKNLQLKCLVKVDNADVIHMHDHLRDLGREIAENELPRRFCRRAAGNINDWLLQQASVLAEARGIRVLPGGHSTKQVGTSSQMLSWYQRNRQMLGNCVMKLRNSYRFLGFEVMNLQLVETEGHLLDGILRLPSPNLIWLSWRDCPYTYLPSWITTKNLRVLKVDGRELETLWHGKSQVPLQLEELEIINASRLSSIPKSIKHLKHLKRIVIYSSFLAKLPKEIGHVNSLRALVLHAGSLKSLPNSLTSLTNLHHVDLRCEKLERLPDSFGSLKNLHRLELYGCKKLERLPDSFGSLTNLNRLELYGCEKLERLPDSFGSLTNLHSLELYGCEKLERLPDSFGSLMDLRRLELCGCKKLERLPDSFGSLTNLHSMCLSGCEKLERLPDSFGSLTNLRWMNLFLCKKLERLPDSFGSLTNLHSMYLSGCEKLERLPDSFGSLTNLHSMDLSGCKKLERLPDSFGSLTNLHSMYLSGCSQMERLPDSFGSLTNFHSMYLSGCETLERLPDSFCSLTNLHWMNLFLCKKLERLPDSFGSLTNLHSMYLSGCEKLQRLPDSFGSLTNLHSMDLSGCKKLERLPDSFGSLTNLHSMYLSWCSQLERLPDSFGSLTNLQSIRLSGCKKLERLPDSFGSLTNLHSMDLSGCEKLERLPDSLGSLPSLVYFNASSCANLTISSETFGNIRTLRHIDFSGCEKVEVWPRQLAHQRSLKTLKLRGTNLKKELPGVIELPGDLEVLWIANPLLDTVMPSLGGLLKLEDLRLEYRWEVKCLPASLERPSQLRLLKVAACPIIHTSEVLSDEVVYPNLSGFILEECINVVEIGTLPKALTSVTLDRCYNLRSIQGLCGLPMLRSLNIEKCNELQALPSVKTLVSLRHLNVADCEKLKNIRDLAHQIELRSLRVLGCPELGKLEGVEYCTSLRNFSVEGCPKLRLGERVVERLSQKCHRGSFYLEEPNRQN